MDIDTGKPPPKPIEECVQSIKELTNMIYELKNDIDFIKMKIKDKEKVDIAKSWYFF